MAGRESAAVEQAVALHLYAQHSISAAARVAKCGRNSLQQALRRRGVAPAKHPSGEAHHARKGKLTP